MPECSTIIPGCAKGVYLAAEQYAKENNIAWGVHLPEYQTMVEVHLKIFP